MFGSAARRAVARDPARAPALAESSDQTFDLFDTIGRFLADHRLGCDPAVYAFAHRLMSDPEGPLARTVAALTDGGVRLTEHDIATLGGSTAPVRAPAPADDTARADELIAQTRSQMKDFTGLVDRMRAETTSFGRDLSASVDALDPALAPGLLSVTATMLARVQHAEAELEQATSEAAGLRAELEEARTDAREDALTGLANRRALAEAFLARSGAVCIAICDVDHFKQVNDRFGHMVGDRVLTAIAATLAQACPGALAARYGGEEFALLFDHADLAKATAALDNARALVAGKRYRLRDGDVVLGTITFSGGIVVAAPGEDFDTVLTRADALLYQAKNGGRNQIVS